MSMSKRARRRMRFNGGRDLLKVFKLAKKLTRKIKAQAQRVGPDYVAGLSGDCGIRRKQCP